MGEARRRYSYRDGVARTAIADENEGLLHIVVEQEVTRILEEIHALRQTVVPFSTNKHAARLPVPIYEDLERRGIANDPVAFKKWLNGPEAAPWRIYQGQL